MMKEDAMSEEWEEKGGAAEKKSADWQSSEDGLSAIRHQQRNNKIRQTRNIAH